MFIWNVWVTPVIVEDSVRRYGAFVLFLFAFVETVPPLSFFSPGVLALIVGGALIERSFTAILFFLAAVLGAALGIPHSFSSAAPTDAVSRIKCM